MERLEYGAVVGFVLAVLMVTTVLGYVETVAVATPVGDISAPEGSPIPDEEIDGVIGVEWDDAGDWVSTDLGIGNQVRAKHDGAYLYILMVVTDDTDDSPPADAHDWAGVDFDRNGDESTMGSPDSADDFQFCDYMTVGGEDWWGTGVNNPRDSDASVEGTNDVVAKKGFDGTHTIWEFKKKLDSGDTAGYDIAMDPSQSDTYGKDRIKVAFAYQDGKSGKHGFHSSWYLLLTVPAPAPPPALLKADLVGRSAWPEHRHFDKSREAGRGEDQINALYAKVANLGEDAVSVKVVFTIFDRDTGEQLGVIETSSHTLAAGEVYVFDTSQDYVNSPEFDTQAWGTGKFQVQAQCFYDSDGDGTFDMAGEKVKSFGFAVVP